MSNASDWAYPALGFAALCLVGYGIYLYAPPSKMQLQYRPPPSTGVGVAYDPSRWPQGPYRHMRRPDDGTPEYGPDERDRPPPPEMAARVDPRFELFADHCRQQIAIRQAQDPNVGVRVTGGPGQRSTCDVDSTFTEQGYVDPGR